MVRKYDARLNSAFGTTAVFYQHTELTLYIGRVQFTHINFALLNCILNQTYHLYEPFFDPLNNHKIL